MSESDKKKGFTFKHELVMLALVFVAPIAISYYLYVNLDNWNSQGGRNHGDLVVPARPLVDVNLQTRDGKDFKFTDLKGKWTLIYMGSSQCDEVCKTLLYKTRQSRLSQGGNISRIQRLFIVTDDVKSDALVEPLKEHREMIVAGSDADTMNKVKEQFILNDKNNNKYLAPVYLVDPKGNLMMSYTTKLDLLGLIKDLSHLLKYSRIG